MYVSRFRKAIYIEGTEKEEAELKKRMRRAMYAAEKKEQERQRDLDRRGYCLDCNLVLSLTHKCPKCGTIWNFHKGGMISR